ncbi:MAG: SDR family oxidoreductase [Chloroflexi bacterium]|nr:SDR family oxidoreductase [Chloroflexota bacterium]
MTKHLEGQVAVVTGGGRGIGRCVSLELARQGVKVIVSDLGGGTDGSGSAHEPADEVVEEIKALGSDAAPIYETVATMDGGKNIIQAAVDNFGRLDILVHVAGILRDRMVFNMSEQEWDDVVNVHLKGLFTTGKHAAILFRQQRSGRMIGFASGAGLMGNPGQANYGAAKDGVAGFIRTAARDLGKYGATCNVVAPVAATRLLGTVTDTDRSAKEKSGVSSPAAGGPRPVAMPRMDPEDVAPVVAFLCTDAAKNINGQILWVQGGMISLINSPYASKTMQKVGVWTPEEIAMLYPQTLGRDVVNPSPPQTAKAQ